MNQLYYTALVGLQMKPDLKSMNMSTPVKMYTYYNVINLLYLSQTQVQPLGTSP